MIKSQFQFYKVRLKQLGFENSMYAAMISILQSSIKTKLSEDDEKEKQQISILQSSIKTDCNNSLDRQGYISILQSSIKTQEGSRAGGQYLVFQFYKVRLKLIHVESYCLLDLFQFYKVRLKPQKARKMIGSIIFQFYKVRLKLISCGMDVASYTFQFYKVRLKQA